MGLVSAVISETTIGSCERNRHEGCDLSILQFGPKRDFRRVAGGIFVPKTALVLRHIALPQVGSDRGLERSWYGGDVMIVVSPLRDPKRTA